MTTIHTLAILCLVGVPVVALVFAMICVGTDRTPHWSEYQWQGEDE